MLILFTSLKGLSHVLQDVEDVLSVEILPKRQEDNFCEILKGCRGLLNEIAVLVEKHSIVESTSITAAGKVRRVWKRLKWDADTVDGLRSRITSQVGLLNAFISSITR